MEYKYFKEFELPTAPEFPDYSVSIADFGAKEGGKDLISDAVRAAIEDVSNHGGGTVVFPKGKWLGGKIHMKDNIRLHFEEGCTVSFTSVKEEYLPVVFTCFEGIRCYNYSPFIYANGCKNIALTGKGELNGNGFEWWSWKLNDDGINDIYTKCMRNSPLEERVYGTKAWGLRPCFVQFIDCENVLLEDITLRESPFWTVHQVWSKKVLIRRLTLKNPRNSHNTDSINIEGCDGVLVEDCHILGGGDDIYTIKSGRGPDGWDTNKPCKNVVIRRCTAHNVQGGGIAIGSEMSGGVENILAYDCDFEDIIFPVSLKSKKGRGGYIKNIEYHNIKCKTMKYGVRLTLKYSADDRFQGNDLTQLPEIRNIWVENLECDGMSDSSIILDGVPGCEVYDVTIKDSTFKNAALPIRIEHMNNITLQNVTVK